MDGDLRVEEDVALEEFLEAPASVSAYLGELTDGDFMRKAEALREMTQTDGWKVLGELLATHRASITARVGKHEMAKGLSGSLDDLVKGQSVRSVAAGRRIGAGDAVMLVDQVERRRVALRKKIEDGERE